METIEKIKWMPVWLIMFSLIFTTGAYFYKETMLMHIGDKYLAQAANKGKFETQDVENMLDDLEGLGFDRDIIEIEISPAAALGAGVSKDSSDEDIELIIDSNRTAFISYIFEVITPGESNIKYRYSRVATSEEYME